MHLAKFGNQNKAFVTSQVKLVFVLLTATTPAYSTNCIFNAVCRLSKHYLSKSFELERHVETEKVQKYIMDTVHGVCMAQAKSMFDETIDVCQHL